MLRYLLLVLLFTPSALYLYHSCSIQAPDRNIFENINKKHNFTTATDRCATKDLPKHQHSTQKEIFHQSYAEPQGSYERFDALLTRYMEEGGVDLLRSVIDEGVMLEEFVVLLSLLEEILLVHEDDKGELKSLYRWVGELYIDHLHQTNKHEDLTAFIPELLDMIEDKNDTKKIIEKIKQIDESLLPPSQKEKAFAKIPLIKHGNQFLIDVMIHSNRYRLLLDTGFSADVLIDTQRAIGDFSDPHEAITLSVVGGHIEAARIGKLLLEIGKVQIHDTDVITARIKSEVFDGLLGMGVLGRFVYEIDLEEGVLILHGWK